MFSIAKIFYFEAAHQLTHLPAGHKCANLHGHSYRATFFFESKELDEHGFVLDFAKLEPIREFINSEFDHRNLNDVLETSFTTSEKIAQFLYARFSSQFKTLVAVRVSETENTFAEYRPMR